MITEDLIAYIQAQLRKNIPESVITSKLSNAGWHEDDIIEGFRKLNPPTIETPKKAEIVYSAPEIKESGIENNNVLLDQLEANKVEILNKPVFAQSFNEANPVLSKEPVKKEEERQLEIYNQELMPALIPKAPPVTVVPPVLPQEEPLFPTPVFSVPAVKVAPVTPPVATPKPEESKILEGLPRRAILHSYQQAISSATQIDTELSKKRKTSIIKWLIIVLIISILGGAIFALANSDALNFSFIKKDPKALLLKAPMVLGSLKSYKIETTASISMPSFADIATGLMTGEAVSSKDTDFVSLYAKGIVSNTNQSPTFDYLANVTSSLMNDSLVIDLKHNNSTSFVTIPNLDNLLGKNAPLEKVVEVPKGGFSSFVPLFNTKIQNKIQKVDLDKVLSIAIPSYVDDETASVLKDFVTNGSVIEKDGEDIHGVPTYHYELSAPRSETKTLLSSFIKVFTTPLSSLEQAYLNEKLGAVTMDSFEIWIGKDDSHIHQYKFSLSAPLSAILDLDDKGIAGNTVNLTWQTSYYDFDVPNLIILPSSTITINDFFKGINDMKIKDSISSFKVSASSLKNALGNYGKRSNPTGSCTNPNPSSIFSPVGHAKGASNAVSSIASIMNNLLETTSGASSCYSTSDAWALSAPLSSDPTSSYCADSAGTTVILKTPLNGTICK